MIRECGISEGSHVSMVEPVGTFDMLILQEHADCIPAASGGVGQLWSSAAVLHGIPQPLVLSPHTFIQPPAQIHR